MSAARRQVLLTGANGEIGKYLRRSLPDLGWDVRSLFRTPPPQPVNHSIIGSVSDLGTMQAACDGVDAVIHMAGISLPGREWAEYVDSNINGTWTILEAARLQGVARVALASSNHAAGFVRRGTAQIPANTPPKPDSLYGVSKAVLEALGSYYADEYGMKTTSMRIGSFASHPRTPRMLATWLSPADLVRLVDAAVTGPWESHETVWGISKNTRRWWSLDEGERIGYFPQDDSEDFAAALCEDVTEYVGGTAPPFGR